MTGMTAPPYPSSVARTCARQAARSTLRTTLIAGGPYRRVCAQRPGQGRALCTNTHLPGGERGLASGRRLLATWAVRPAGEVGEECLRVALAHDALPQSGPVGDVVGDACHGGSQRIEWRPLADPVDERGEQRCGQHEPAGSAGDHGERHGDRPPCPRDGTGEDATGGQVAETCQTERLLPWMIERSPLSRRGDARAGADRQPGDG